MAVAVADTHAVIWYLFDDARLSPRARTVIESAVERNEVIAVSAISLVEMIYLEERRRIPRGTRQRVVQAFRDESAVLHAVAIDADVADALGRLNAAEISDMPDRIIAATALHLRVPVISRDRKIRASQLETIW